MENQYDGVFHKLLAEKQGYDGFFDEVFGFLRRKTDFFTDFKKAEAVIAKSGEKHVKLLNAQKAKKKETPVPKKQEPPKPKPKETKKAETPKPAPTKPQEKTDSDKLAPNSGNGGQTDTYYWTQTLEEVSLTVPLVDNLGKRNMIIELTTTHCYISTKDKSTVYINDEWCENIHADDTIWLIEEDSKGNKLLSITITKWRNDMKWWDRVVKKEPKIDTSKINPEPSKISDLQGDMKTQVSKMMFDMQQKQQGKPSSDELEKQAKIQQFMKAHPEMDFSNAKFGN